MAEDLRVPVSNLVRNVLEEAFSVVEAVSENVGDLIDDVVDEAERTRHRIRRRRRNAHHRSRRRFEDAPNGEEMTHTPVDRQPFPDVIGWQPLILNQAKACADCEEPIEIGERGFAGTTAAGIGAVYLCRDCMDARH